MKLNITRPYLLLLLIPLVLGGLGGCVGTQSFTTAARPGETVSLAAGWQKSIKQENLTVNITDAGGTLTTYAPSDPRVRSIVNLYPDPLSGAIVGKAIGNTSTFDRSATSQNINYMTGNDPDWWQTTIFLDLPTTMSIGKARINLINGSKTIPPIYVEILQGASLANPFGVYIDKAGAYTNAASDAQLQSMGRVANYVVTFTGGSVFPDSIQLQFTHDTDSTIPGGIGKTFVVNPRGEKKNLSWTDDGANLRVMLTSTGDGTNKYGGLTTYKWNLFKFYVTGGITGLTQPTVKAYDINGNLMSGVTASVTLQ